MDITVSHQQLHNGLELLSRISTKHVALPVLQCIRVSAKNNQLVLQATNLEVSLEVLIDAQVNEEGEVAVPAQTFLQSIQFITDPSITLRTEDQVLQIETEAANTSIKLFSIDEFPTLKKISGTAITVGAEMFSLGIKSVAFAASQTSIKPELGSVCVQQKKEHSLTFVATDSFRLMEKTVPQKSVVLDQSLMIPYKNALEVARVCDAVGGEVVVTVSENQCAFLFSSGAYLVTRLVTGSFPDYEQIIPKEYVTHATVLKDDLQRSFKKTSIFLNKFRQVTLTITSKNVTVASQNNDVGHTTHSIKADVTGEDLTLSFNQQYIMDPLTHLYDDSVKLSFAGIGRAMILKGATDTTVRYLVMPMNK